jgi:hypothetical protein
MSESSKDAIDTPESKVKMDGDESRSTTPSIVTEPVFRKMQFANRPEPIITKRPNHSLHNHKQPVPAVTNWYPQHNTLRPVPNFYPLEKTSRYIHDSAENIAARMSDACRLMSVHAEYDNEAGTALLMTDDHVEIFVSLWKGDAKAVSSEYKTDQDDTEDENLLVTIVEVQRRKGCSVSFHKYGRRLLDSASGTFIADDNAYSVPKVSPCIQEEQKKDEESSVLALEIAASLLRKDRMDARRLGLESLCLLTDPDKAGVETAKLSSQVVLFGSVQDAQAENADFIPDELGIREAILSLVQFGRLGEYGDFEDDLEDEEVDNDEKEFNDVLHNLALGVLSNALAVLEPEKNACEDVSDSTDSFLEESREISKKELLSTLLNVLGKAEAKPHDACLSAQCLKCLFQASKKAKKRARELKAKQIVMTALDVGRRTHVKLETETKRIIKELEKTDDEEEGEERGNNQDSE